ncbi:SDR family oxidoreductase [Nitratidesulfovibrio termitidis]|uniref:SDR family oxidoreductase n=1 Tax=Nitratidesulfovibrio termitidis TaxID=42252 RepID=UPI001FDF9945|nr:SDR family oxidoreductase [Nitratidesulfovibrio termitidis]
MPANTVSPKDTSADRSMTGTPPVGPTLPTPQAPPTPQTGPIAPGAHQESEHAGIARSGATPALHPSPERGTVLITGATGYVGGRLAPLLLERGWKVRALARNPAKLTGRPWAAHPGCDIVRGDMLDEPSLREALRGCDAAFYLVHSMNPAVAAFADADRKAAYCMVRALQALRGTQDALPRVIYLSGLLPPETDTDGHGASRVSEHLRSRAEVGEILALADAPLTVLRAAQIIGSGSASFEIIRYLADRLPVMITPRWVHMQCQPIAISNVLEYLAGCLDHPETAGQAYDIGGPDVLSYRELFDIYARQAGLRRRLIIPVPFLTPELSAHWLHLVTPVPVALARPLIHGLRQRVVCGETRIRDIIPQDLLPCDESIRRALDRLRTHAVPTRWTDAGSPAVPEWVVCGDADYAGGHLLGEGWGVRLAATPEAVWKPVERIGGDTGWYQDNTLWRLRGLLDTLVGGPGLRRGRRDPDVLRTGDALDFWRVLDVQPGKRLLLLAEMKVPGDALLEFVVRPIADADPAHAEGGTRTGAPATELWMQSWFLPRGLAGLAYWYVLLPVHGRIFRGMLAAIATATGAPVLRVPFRLPAQRNFACALPGVSPTRSSSPS